RVRDLREQLLEVVVEQARGGRQEPPRRVGGPPVRRPFAPLGPPPGDGAAGPPGGGGQPLALGHAPRGWAGADAAPPADLRCPPDGRRAIVRTAALPRARASLPRRRRCAPARCRRGTGVRDAGAPSAGCLPPGRRARRPRTP